MSRRFILENNRERERMKSLADSLSDRELGLVYLKEGWTIAAGLAHVAFWDQRRLLLVRRWKKEGYQPSALEEGVINDALLPFLLQIEPRKAADMAVSIAEELDRELESSSGEFIALMESSGDPHALNRGVHRKMHLDDIETFLKGVAKS